MHDDATQLAAFALASFALVAALIPLAGDIARSRAGGRRTREGKTGRRGWGPDLRLLLHYPASQPAGAAAVALIAAPPLFFAALLVLDSWRRHRPVQLGDVEHRATTSPTVVVDMLGTATAAVVVAGVAVARGGVPSWVVFPAGLTSA